MVEPCNCGAPNCPNPMTDTPERIAGIRKRLKDGWMSLRPDTAFLLKQLDALKAENERLRALCEKYMIRPDQPHD